MTVKLLFTKHPSVRKRIRFGDKLLQRKFEGCRDLLKLRTDITNIRDSWVIIVLYQREMVFLIYFLPPFYNTLWENPPPHLTSLQLFIIILHFSDLPSIIETIVSCRFSNRQYLRFILPLLLKNTTFLTLITYIKLFQ